MQGLRGYMLAVNAFYEDVDNGKPDGYCKEDKDGGYRSWLRLTGENMTVESTAIANAVIYPPDMEVKKPVKLSPQLYLF
jgi:hypothetical protein